MLFIIMAVILLVAIVAPSWERLEERPVLADLKREVCWDRSRHGSITGKVQRALQALTHRYHARWYTGSTGIHRSGRGRAPQSGGEGFSPSLPDHVFLFWACKWFRRGERSLRCVQGLIGGPL